MNDDQYFKFDQKLDQISTRLDNVDVTLIKQAGQLEHHIYRTELLEKRTDLINEELKPIIKKDAMVMGGFKVIGLIFSVISFIYTVIKIIKFVS